MNGAERETEQGKLAAEYFRNGYNCAQAVFCAFAPRYGIASDVAFRLASGFGGGVAQMGDTCGVLTGAIMVMGLHFSSGVAGDAANKQEVYAKIRPFIDQFIAAHGSHLCRDLKQLSGDPPSHREQCTRYVEEAAAMLSQVLSE